MGSGLHLFRRKISLETHYTCIPDETSLKEKDNSVGREPFGGADDHRDGESGRRRRRVGTVKGSVGRVADPDCRLFRSFLI